MAVHDAPEYATLADIDYLMQTLSNTQDESERLSLESFSNLRTITSLGLACFGLLALTVNPRLDENRLFPRDWLGSTESVNPDRVVSHLLCNLTNYAISVEILARKGFDTQARSQLRVFMELSWLSLNLISEREIFSRFVNLNEEEEKKFWASNLKSFQLNKRLSELEELLGVDIDTLADIKQSRKNNYAFYSNIVHHSYTSIMLGALAFSDVDESTAFNVFGKVSSSSKSTLSVLNTEIWYFLLAFFAILDKKHHISPVNPKDDFWAEAFSIYKCVGDVYLGQLAQQTAS